MLMVGDWIDCHDNDDMVKTADDLMSEGYGVSLCFDTHRITIISVPEGEG